MRFFVFRHQGRQSFPVSERVFLGAGEIPI